MAIKTDSKVGVFDDCCLFVCCPGGRRGNMERVIAQWWRPVASEVALDMPHWAMPSLSPRSTAMAIKSKWPTREVHLFIDDFAIINLAIIIVTINLN
jgi:hypothetical protein